MESQDRGSETNPILVTALAMGKTQAEAARLSGTSERTIRRRLTEDPTLRAAVFEERTVMAAQLAGQLLTGGATAIEVLGELMAADLPPQVRLGAVRTMLMQGGTFREVEVEARLSDLLRAVQGGADDEA